MKDSTRRLAGMPSFRKCGLSRRPTVCQAQGPSAEWAPRCAISNHPIFALPSQLSTPLPRRLEGAGHPGYRDL